LVLIVRYNSSKERGDLHHQSLAPNIKKREWKTLRTLASDLDLSLQFFGCHLWEELQIFGAQFTTWKGKVAIYFFLCSRNTTSEVSAALVFECLCIFIHLKTPIHPANPS
jgi:hypothetical protein